MAAAEDDAPGFAVGQFISKGVFGSVSVALRMVDGRMRKVAQKKIFNPAAGRDAHIEFEGSMNLIHPNLVRVHGMTESPNHEFYLIDMDLCTGGDLQTALGEGSSMREDVLRTLLWQLLQGLRALHAHDPPILHRDLKPANLLLSRDPETQTLTLCIGDFGLARLISTTAPMSRAGTPEYMAPEVDVQDRRRPYDVSADLFSVGRIALRALTGLNFNNIIHGPLQKLGARISDARDAIKTRVSDDLIDLIFHMQHASDSMRKRYLRDGELLVDSYLSHRFFDAERAGPGLLPEPRDWFELDPARAVPLRRLPPLTMSSVGSSVMSSPKRPSPVAVTPPSPSPFVPSRTATPEAAQPSAFAAPRPTALDPLVWPRIAPSGTIAPVAATFTVQLGGSASPRAAQQQQHWPALPADPMAALLAGLSSTGRPPRPRIGPLLKARIPEAELWPESQDAAAFALLAAVVHNEVDTSAADSMVFRFRALSLLQSALRGAVTPDLESAMRSTGAEILDRLRRDGAPASLDRDSARLTLTMVLEQARQLAMTASLAEARGGTEPDYPADLYMRAWILAQSVADEGGQYAAETFALSLRRSLFPLEP